MKKIVLTVSFVLTMCMNVFAEETAVADTKCYDMSVNYKRLGCFLELTEDQVDAVKAIHEQFRMNMNFASDGKSEKQRNSVVRNAITTDIKWMRCVLNDEQYKKYITVLNATLVNKGFSICEISGESISE